MNRKQWTDALATAGVREFTSARIVAADEDLGLCVCGALIGDISDFYRDVFFNEPDMVIRMEFLPEGVRLTAPQVDGREHGGPGQLPYGDLADESLAALHGLVHPAPR